MTPDLLLLLLWPTVAIAAAPFASRAIHAPIQVPRGSNADLVADQYVVYLRSGAHDTRAVLDAFHIKPTHEYTALFRGFSANLDAQTLRSLQKHPDVKTVVPVIKMYASSSERAPGNSTGAMVAQSNIPWNLNLLSNPTSTSPNGSKYTYDARAGEGTCVYVVDSGVDDTHPEFEGRALQVKSFVANATGDNHIQGHGTHVAGIIGSASYGVAKKAKIFGIKILDAYGAGSFDGFIAGLDFVPIDAANRSCPNGVIVNFSIGTPVYHKGVNEAAAALVKKGIFVATSAGNFGVDVAFTSPASERTVCTVGSFDINGFYGPSASYGQGVDILAPGVDILSLQPDNRTALYTGTSQAAPHVAGLAAYFASIFGKSSLPTMCQYLRDVAAKGVIKNPKLYTTDLVVSNAVVHK